MTFLFLSCLQETSYLFYVGKTHLIPFLGTTPSEKRQNDVDINFAIKSHRRSHISTKHIKWDDARVSDDMDEYGTDEKWHKKYKNTKRDDR